jgi:hypothetical protein
MRSSIALPFAYMLLVLTSCATVRVDGYRVFGRVHEVSEADIRAAVVAFQGSHLYAPSIVGSIQVISHDEIRIYWPASGNYDVMKRIRGKWRHVGGMVITS